MPLKDEDSFGDEGRSVLIVPGLLAGPAQPGSEPLLLGNECLSCGSVFFPARRICPDCFGEGRLADRELSGRGRVYASTVVRIPTPVGIAAPYAYGYVDLDDTPVRVFGLFTGADPEWFTPGRAVRPVVDIIRRDDQGREVIGYKFRPLDKDGDDG